MNLDILFLFYILFSGEIRGAVGMREGMAADGSHVVGSPRRVHGSRARGGGRRWQGEGAGAADWRDTHCR